jgi:hypothetical protein
MPDVIRGDDSDPEFEPVVGIGRVEALEVVFGVVDHEEGQ